MPVMQWIARAETRLLFVVLETCAAIAPQRGARLATQHSRKDYRGHPNGPRFRKRVHSAWLDS